VPGGDYRDALRDRAGWTAEPGPLLDETGERVGEHGGAAAYTVGQRRNLGVALGAPRYVSRIDPLSNTIQLGRREDLETRSFVVERASFVAGDAPAGAGPFRAAVRIRHRAVPIPAVVHPLGERRLEVRTDEPVWAAAPGQAAVLYDGDLVLGGGRIARTEPAPTSRPAPAPVAVGA
jgi:tRNA-uridine 2-sulfurtransferase